MEGHSGMEQQRGERERDALRVLMIAPTSFFSDYGCHVRILEEARGLQARGHQVTICTYRNGGAVPDLTIRRSLGSPGPKRAVVGSSRHKLYLDAALSLRTIGTALALRPDLIHAHLHEGALIGGALARLLRRPLLFDYQGSLTAEMIDHGFLREHGPLHRPTRALEGIANRCADAVVTSTTNAATLLARDFRLGSDRVSTLADGVDTTRFRPDIITAAERMAGRARYGITPDRKVIVYLGLLAPHQGTGVLLEAARRVIAREPRAFFLIGGFPGNELYRLHAEALGLGAATSFPGCIPYGSAAEFLALGDLAVGPKLSQTEGNGKLYNYSAMGLPAVAFETPANREILGNYGLYAPLGSAVALADGLLHLLAHPAEATARGRALRQRAMRQLSWDARIDDLLRVYSRLLAVPVSGVAPTLPPTSGPSYARTTHTTGDGDD
jgi:glycosyltransferase involved in cell wall biosynthesis